MNHFMSLGENIQYMREQHLRVLTPTGKPKKLPWYAIVQCSWCRDITITSSYRPVPDRFRCTRRDGKGYSRCGHVARIVDGYGIEFEALEQQRMEWMNYHGSNA